MKELNLKYMEIVQNRLEKNIISGKAAVEYMKNSTAVYKDVPVACLYMPKLFSKDAFDYLTEAANTICLILDKVIKRYLDDPKYRALFPFSKEVEELILIDAGYPRLLPISRLDIFFNEDDFTYKFCEFNADGASAMNEDREICTALQSTDAFYKMREEYEITPFELFDTWVREFIDIYGTYNKKASYPPNIIITDFMDRATPNEFIEFKKAFQKAGYSVDICDIRDLKYDKGVLLAPDGNKVDVVYRRAVTRDIMERREEVEAFIQAARDNAACIIGHFRTQVIHNKVIFMILRMPETLEFLTEEEREYILEHIPETISLKKGLFDFDEVLKNKNEWLIKPQDLYASKGVYAGVDMDMEAWRKVIEQSVGTDYLLQRYCPPYQTLNLDFNDCDRPDFETYNNITGMFVYNGKLVGLYSRGGQRGIVSTLAEGKTMASMMAKPKGKYFAERFSFLTPVLVVGVLYLIFRFNNSCSICQASLWLWLQCSSAVYISIFFWPFLFLPAIIISIIWYKISF